MDRRGFLKALALSPAVAVVQVASAAPPRERVIVGVPRHMPNDHRQCIVDGLAEIGYDAAVVDDEVRVLHVPPMAPEKRAEVIRALERLETCDATVMPKVCECETIAGRVAQRANDAYDAEIAEVLG